MKIFDSTKLGSLELKNKLFAAPIKTAYGETVTDRHIAYYSALAKGGVSMIFLEPIAVLENGREHPKQLRLDKKDYINSIAAIIDTIHLNGSLACIHINHAGRAANPKIVKDIIAPSDTTCPATGAFARQITKEEIKKTVEAFGNVATYAKDVKADMIEIQMGLGYLISQFFSRNTNKRTDEYADPLKFANEVLEAVKATNVPFGIRISGYEAEESGLKPNDIKPLIDLAEDKGALSIHISMGNVCETPQLYYHHMFVSTELQEKALDEIRDLTKLPIIASGRFGNPERLKKEEQLDRIQYFALGRSLIADQDFPNKLKNNELNKIVYCGGCLQGCVAKVKANEGLGCIANPLVGFPDKITKTDNPKKIAIVGGGPAGLEASFVLKQRGHDVTLFEKSDKLGGTANLASLSVGKTSLMKPVHSLVDLAIYSGVNIKLNTQANDVTVKNFDVVISAVGAHPKVLNVPGLDNIKSLTGHDFFSNMNILSDKKRILVIGGGMIGIEASEILLQQNKDVVIIEIFPDIARDMETITRKITLSRLNQKNCKIYTNTKLLRFESTNAICSINGKKENLGSFDAVLFSVGIEPNPSLSKAFYIIGDALQGAQIFDAVQSGFKIGLKI